MKSLVTRIFSALMLTVVFLPAFAHAQHTSAIKVSIPFEFSFGGKTYPAGDYSVTEPLQHFVVLQNENGKPLAGRFTQGLETYGQGSRAKVKFYVVDGQHILSEVWQDWQTVGEYVAPAKAAKVAKRPATEAGELALGKQQ